LGPGFPGVSGALLGVTRSRFPLAEPMPAMVYHIEPFGSAYPLGELPPEYIASALDIDPATGEIWIAARIAGQSATQLLNISVFDPFQSAPALQDDEEFAAAAAPGVVINRVLSSPVPPTAVRGVGFDDGHMFVVTTNRFLHEIDRTTGEILRTAELPITGLIGGLSGGTLVPEPDAMAMTATMVAVALAGRRRK
jgi:hypothetical protein